MSLNIKVKSYDVDSTDETKIVVGFAIKDEDGASFLIDKSVAKESKSQETIISEAYSLATAEIDDWVNTTSAVGKTFDPSNGSLTV